MPRCNIHGPGQARKAAVLTQFSFPPRPWPAPEEPLAAGLERRASSSRAAAVQQQRRHGLRDRLQQAAPHQVHQLGLMPLSLEGQQRRQRAAEKQQQLVEAHAARGQGRELAVHVGQRGQVLRAGRGAGRRGGWRPEVMKCWTGWAGGTGAEEAHDQGPMRSAKRQCQCRRRPSRPQSLLMCAPLLARNAGQGMNACACACVCVHEHVCNWRTRAGFVPCWVRPEG